MKKLVVSLAVLLCVTRAHAFDSFTVKDIRLEGLQRISIGTVFNYLPIKVGEQVNEEDATNAVQVLFKTGFFKDVRLEREGEVLVVFVAERPAISEININGNDEIGTEDLKKALKDMGLEQGRVFDRVVLERIEYELKRQYYSLGKYGVKVTTDVEPLERNRIAVNINIAEGDDAEVYAINFVGNKTYSSELLQEYFILSEAGMFGGRDSYSRQVLAGDLESLRSFYMDRGHINFNIDSTQVSLTPDKQDVYLTINITEGEVYTVRDVKVLGDVIIPKEKLEKLILVEKGQLFSRRNVTDTRKNITDALAEMGYPFSNVNVAPGVDEDSRSVELTIFVDPGRRVYVRRINISGNLKSKDEVVRRELRQNETDWLSTENVSQSQKRLTRTGFFEDVSVETPAVPGTQDLVDLNLNVKEKPTGSLTFGVGYSDTQGAILNFGISQDNFMGGGKRMSLNVDTSKGSESYGASVTDPYYTLDGISRTLSVSRRRVDAEDLENSNYLLNTDTVLLSYGIPLSELSRLNGGFSFENSELVTSDNTSDEIKDYVTNNNDGDPDYNLYKLSGSWVYDSRNKPLIAEEGARVIVSFEGTFPGSDLEFYKVGFDYTQYFTITEGYTFLYNLEMDYGQSYGDTTEIPPFERYYVGGSRTLRGYEANSVGNQRDSNGDPLGGDRSLVSNLELILPNPFSDRSEEIRLSAFIDAGFVWAPDEKLDLGDLRYSAGVSLIWIAPIGLMRFSLAEALNPEPTDELSAFQFTLGTLF